MSSQEQITMQPGVVGVIGAGAVGAEVCTVLMHSGVATEIILVDVDKTRCQGQVMDLQDGSFITDTTIRVGTYEEVARAQLIVITAGAAQRPGESRNELLERNCKILSMICSSLGRISPESVVLLVANPVDVLASLFQKMSGLPHRQVIGSGTFLDSMRWRKEIGRLHGIAASSVHAYVLGEHGDAQVPILSTVSVGGVPVREVGCVTTEQLEQAGEVARKRAYEIINRKGSTYFGVASCVLKMAQSVLLNRCQVFPLSVYESTELHGYVSVPAVLGGGGVHRVLSLAYLRDSEKKKLHEAADCIRQRVDLCSQFCEERNLCV